MVNFVRHKLLHRGLKVARSSTNVVLTECSD